MVTVDGRFRTGVLRGRHAKAEAEHIGLTARRAALQRRRAEVEAQWGEARAVLAATDQELRASAGRIDDVRALRAELPSAAVVARSVLVAEMAEAEVTRTRQVQTERRADRDHAEDVHAAAVDSSRRTAANLGLPTDAEGLQRVDDDLSETTRLAQRAGDAVTALVRSVGQWRRAGQSWQQSVEDERRARRSHLVAVQEHEPLAARLATLEDSIGVAYAEIVASIQACETDEKRTAQDLGTASGAPLPTDPLRSPPTPWDPDLQRAFDQHRRIVHEERLLPGLLEFVPTAG